MRFSGLLRAWRRAVRGLLPNVCAGEFRRAIVKDGLRAAQPFLGERLADSRAVRSHLAPRNRSAVWASGLWVVWVLALEHGAASAPTRAGLRRCYYYGFRRCYGGVSLYLRILSSRSRNGLPETALVIEVAAIARNHVAFQIVRPEHFHAAARADVNGHAFADFRSRNLGGSRS